VQTTAVGCPSVDGNTCEITKEIDVDFDWSPGAMVELKCRYESPTWPFELDLEGIAKPGCNPDISKCGRPVTPTFNSGYLFSIGGPEIGVTPKKPGSIRIAGFDFSSLKNIKLCIKHPDCYVDYYDNDFGDAEDVGCDEGSVSTSSSSGNGMEQQSFALTASPVCNIGAALGNKFSADVSKRQLFKAGDDCARNINFAELNKFNVTNLPKGFKLTDSNSSTPAIAMADVHVNGKFVGSFCSANAPRIILNDLKKRYDFNKEDGKIQYCYPDVTLSQDSGNIELNVTDKIYTDDNVFYKNLFPKVISRAWTWLDWINNEINTAISSSEIEQCLKDIKGNDLISFLKQGVCWGDLVDKWNQFMDACIDPNCSPDKPCYDKVSPGYTIPAGKNYRFILHQANPIKPVAEVTKTIPTIIYEDQKYIWASTLAEEKEYLASMALERLVKIKQLSCGKYVCCQMNKEEKANCMEGCGYANACKAYPTDFLAFTGGGTDAKVYTDMCLNKYLKIELPPDYNLTNPSKGSLLKQLKNGMMCTISNVMNSKSNYVNKFKSIRPNLEDFIDPNDFIEIPKGGPSPTPGPDPGPLVTDPSPIDLMKQYMNPGNPGSGSKRMFDNNKNGNPFNGKP
jgi:hypothetical protein